MQGSRDSGRWRSALRARWRETVLDFLDETARVGCRLLAEAGLPVEEPAYLLMKMICYHPGEGRSGVAARCDWSWLTVLFQDDVGGLETMDEHGRWRPVPEPVCVHYGELAEIATGGKIRSDPHRVINPSSTRSRVSIPVFICPPLEAIVRSRAAPFDEPGEHVHRVRYPAEVWGDFRFGESEWRRKGEGRWRWREECLAE
ncbi:MAG: isopenicillin N synthase family oxygenase [Bryobacteraceae bacterium]|nr:isopenicillin N synthase family oxygenase [Bryobacteraceae bacterium]